jgi:hypothetical protein
MWQNMEIKILAKQRWAEAEVLGVESGGQKQLRQGENTLGGLSENILEAE